MPKETQLLWLNQCTPTSVDWLWPGHPAAGKLALLDGEPGQGKSLLTLDLAARLSTGSPWPDGQPAPGPANVVLFAAEVGRSAAEPHSSLREATDFLLDTLCPGGLPAETLF